MRHFDHLLACAAFSVFMVCARVESATIVPSSFSPGQPSSFVLRLPPVSNLGSFNVELLLTSPSGVAGTDFFFDAGMSQPVSSGYIFPDTTNFFAAANVISGNRHSLTLSDFALVGTDIVEGVNDGVATVMFTTLPGFKGALSLSLGQDSFQLDTPAATPTQVSGFAAARNFAASSVDVTVIPVPESTTIGLAAIAVLTSATRYRKLILASAA
jgi:hypothetical protein